MTAAEAVVGARYRVTGGRVIHVVAHETPGAIVEITRLEVAC